MVLPFVILVVVLIYFPFLGWIIAFPAQALPDGTTDDVRPNVYRALTAMFGNGGYGLSPAHNIQPDVPMENVIAIYKAGKQFFGNER